MMFHEGDLQSGIALAVQEGKAVVCFVRGKFTRLLSGPTVLNTFGEDR